MFDSDDKLNVFKVEHVLLVVRRFYVEIVETLLLIIVSIIGLIIRID